MTQHDNRGDLDLTKKIELLEEENHNLLKEIDRLNEYVQNLEIIDSGHQKLNGELRVENAKLTLSNKKLEEKVYEFVRPTKRREDDI
tara:strand:- start:122 stop:382 length:261 start_codon:yes stop_codon:yes gene_type:complete